jgi:predicted DNA-binding transcriptional regulator AlpA
MRYSPALRQPLSDYDAARRLMRLEDVMTLIGFRSKESVYALIHEGRLAKPVKIGRASRWRAADVHAFIESCEPDPLSRPVKSKS